MKYNIRHIGAWLLAVTLWVSFGVSRVEAQDTIAAEQDSLILEPKTQPLERVVVGYITSWGGRMPNPALVTHLNYAFGHVTDSFDDVRIDRPERLRSIVELKQQNPNLRVLLSIGGWKSGGFSEMAQDEQLRKTFARNCRQTVERFGLDGIDIDWEYPTNGHAGIGYSVYDIRNFTLLMRDLREALGPDYLLTFADYADTLYADYVAVMPYVDYINVMSYEMGKPPYLNAPLYRSKNTRTMSVSDSMERHLKAGVPAEKLVMGIPFYGDGSKKYQGERRFGRINLDGRYTELWDSIAMVPYLVDETVEMVLTHENEESVRVKCEYLNQKQLRGAMYWDVNSDDERFTLSQIVWRWVKEKRE